MNDENRKSITTPSPPSRGRQRRRTIVKWVKRAIWIAAVVGVVGAVVYAMLPRSIPVDVAEVARTELRVLVAEDGKTRVKHRYTVMAPLSGNMPRLTLDPGDQVDEGQVVLRIVPAPPALLDARSRAQTESRLAAALATARRAEAEVSRARVALESAERDTELARSLLAQNAATSRELERAEFAERARAQELAAAEFAVKVAQQEVAAARAALGIVRGSGDDGIDLQAPVSGEVLRVVRQDAGIVQAGTPLLELGDPASLEVVVDVLTTDAVNIEPGAPVSIVRWGGDTAIPARVRRVEPSAFTRVSALGVEEQRVNVIIDFDAPPEALVALGDGYRVEAEITVWAGADVVSVPASAVFRHGEGWAAYRVADGTARLTPVAIGRRSDLRVEIESGLVPGALVIAHPSDRIADGVAVEVRPD